MQARASKRKEASMHVKDILATGPGIKGVTVNSGGSP